MVQKVNTKTLIQERLKAKKSNVTSTLSVPKPTEELKNVETLNSKNLVGEGNTPLPKEIKDQKIAEGVEKNTPGMAACIKEKIKDLIGVFTVPFGIPSLDQFKVPDLGDAKNLSIKDAFKATFEDIKNTAKDTVKGIKEAFTIKKQNGLDQVETGGLSLKKMLGCEEVPTEFTPRERKDFAEKPETVEKIEKESVKKSQIALATQADENVKQRTEPPADKSKQEDVEGLTDVEVVPPINWNYYSIRIYETPIADKNGLTPKIKQILNDAGVSIISTSDKPPEGLFIFAVKQILENSVKYLYDIISLKEKDNEVAKYDMNEFITVQDALKELPAGYLVVHFSADNSDYGLDDATSDYATYVTYNLTAYVTRNDKPLQQIYSDTTNLVKSTNRVSYAAADRYSILYFIEGETKPFAPKNPYFLRRIDKGLIKQKFKY